MNCKLLVMDVDGTLTDGRIYVGAAGETMKAFDVKDGYAIIHLQTHGITPMILTGRSSAIVTERARELGIAHLHQGVHDKRALLANLATEMGILPAEIAYIGDDLNDLDAMAFCGITACPADAVAEVRVRVNYVCKRDGGRGAVREFIEHLFTELGEVL